MNALIVFTQGDAVLTATFMLLAVMSFTSWYVIIWKAWKLHRERASLHNFKKECTSSRWPETLTPLAEKSAVALLVNTTASALPLLSNYPANERKEVLGMQLAHALDNARAWLDKGLTALASIGTSAPFIGLFGTVWGVYGALMDISKADNASLTVVAGPMGEALTATAAGLFAAIPAVLAYNAYVRANRMLVQDLRHIAEQLALYCTVERTALYTVLKHRSR